MPIVTAEIARAHLERLNAEIHSLHVTSDRNVIVYHATFPAQTGQIRDIPALFAVLCVSGFGVLRQTSALQKLDIEMTPGCICVTPPNTKGYYEVPEGTVVAIGLSVEIVAESFGRDWPRKLKKETFSSAFRDPLVESTLMNVGYGNDRALSDATLVHAAHMVTHQLLDDPFVQETTENDAQPLSRDIVAKLESFLQDNLDRHVSVEEMARFVGISRHHFSRRFKAATGKSPYQFAIQGKLEFAWAAIKEEESASILSIAQRLGYDSPSQFSKVFKRHFGFPPRLLRSRHRP